MVELTHLNNSFQHLKVDYIFLKIYPSHPSSVLK